jgi:transcriptional regulator with XRE-family HTH domain
MNVLYCDIEESMSFGEIIRSARRRQNWTQEKLAAKLSCTKTAVCKWEANKSIPPLAKFSALADALGIMPDALFGGVERSASPAPAEIKIDRLLMKAWQKLSPQQRTKLVQIAEILSR